MAAPIVQPLSQVIAELNPAFAGQEAVIQKKQAGLGAKYDAQRSGLIAEKGEGFNAINESMNSRGLAFGGLTGQEQARYLSTKFLPGMQAANEQQNNEDLELQGQIAQIGTQKTTQAMNMVEKQKSDLNSWNMQEASLAAQARENALNRQASAAEAAANRAAQQRADAPPSINQYISDSLASYYNGENVKNGWTEDVLARQVAAQYGITKQEALSKYIYPTRKKFQ